MRSTELILVPGSDLRALYRRAFSEAVEIYILSAYLTSWDDEVKLRRGCKIKLIVGQDFGITRKDACQKVLKWLPKNQRINFRVAVGIGGFHPKAIFWMDEGGSRYVLVGSSNLTDAAFRSNYEANLYQVVSNREYGDLVRWFEKIKEHTVEVGPNWFKSYNEVKLRGRKVKGGMVPTPTYFALDRMVPSLGNRLEAALLKSRRAQVRAFSKIKRRLRKVFAMGASGDLSKNEVFESAMALWGRAECRFQAPGWERRGKGSKWKAFCIELEKIFAAPITARDDAVSAAIDSLFRQGISMRGAFLSEMLCQFYGDRYPVKTGPVKWWLKKIKYHDTKGASEGARYINLAKSMRTAIAKHPRVKNLAELDLLIWAKSNPAAAKKQFSPTYPPSTRR